FLADALQRQGRLDEALAAVTRLKEINPEAPVATVEIRQGNWLIEAGRTDDAVAYYRQAVDRGADPNQVARIIFGDAINKGVRQENYSYASRLLTAAKQFNVNAETRSEFDFWHGWSLYYLGMAAQQPQ